MKIVTLSFVLKPMRKPTAAILAMVLTVLSSSGCSMAAQVERTSDITAATIVNAPPGARDVEVAVQQQVDAALVEATPTANLELQTTNTPQVTDDSIDPPEDLVVTHRVVAGDTLTRIATRYDVSVASLLRANDLPNPDLLTVGQIINLPNPPVDYTPSFLILPDSRLVRSVRAADFNVERFLKSRGGALSRMTVVVAKRLADGRIESSGFTASAVIERVSREYSVDARILLAFLEHFAGLITENTVETETELYPLLQPEETSRINRTGLYAQLIWLADQLNQGYYGWKYRGDRVLELSDGSRLFYARDLNAGTIAVQYALGQMSGATDWKTDSSDTGIFQTYSELFGEPFDEAYQTMPADLEQPQLTLPFPRGETWRFTGGFHGGWGNGSAWAAVDFAAPAEAQQVGPCYTSSYPATAVARGTIARLEDGLVVLDLDEDSNEATGWTILYLHVDAHDSLTYGQLIEAGNIIGYPSCLGGFTNATHLHIARRYNGEWIPADCNRCPPSVSVPAFVMSNWKVVGLESQLYQGFMIHELDNRSVVAEQGRFTSINEISW